MTDSDAEDGLPDGYRLHDRPSGMTAPWRPIYARVTSEAYILALRVREPHLNARGFVHGGLISTLSDNAMGYSCAHRLGGHGLVTINLNVDYLGMARAGAWLEFATHFVRAGRSICFAQCYVTADGEVVARANATFKVMARDAA